MLPFATVTTAVFDKQTVFLVSCGGTKVVSDVVVSVPVVELDVGWLWSLVVPELLEEMELGLELLQILVSCLPLHLWHRFLEEHWETQ